MPDSVNTATDSVQPYYAPSYTDGFPDSTGNDTTVAPLDRLPVMTVPEGQRQPAHNSPLTADSWVMLGLLAVIVLLMASYRSGYKYIQNLFHHMFSVRRRENLFEDRTVNESRILLALILLTAVAEGVIAYFGLCHYRPDLAPRLTASPTLFVGLLAAEAIGFFLLQLALFSLLGYVFSDSVSTGLWLDGFKASQSILGLLLLPAAGVALASAGCVRQVLIYSAIMYVSARFVFICKGFRIFYSNLLSHVYFILYLCAVEIVPLILLYVATVGLCRVI